MAKGKLIVVEGLDGSGKGTQSGKLVTNLNRVGRETVKVSFPNYEDKAAGALKMYLNGEFGTDPDSVNAYAASTFFAVDRFSSYKRDWQGKLYRGVNVVCDRYTTSNAIHQMAKLPKENWDEFLSWLFDFEFNKLGLPSPDAVIYLDMDVAVSQKLIEERCKDKNIKKDIHEADVAYLKKCREAAHYCADKLGWKIMKCNVGETPLPIEEIATDIFELVQKI